MGMSGDGSMCRMGLPSPLNPITKNNPSNIISTHKSTAFRGTTLTKSFTAARRVGAFTCGTLKLTSKKPCKNTPASKTINNKNNQTKKRSTWWSRPWSPCPSYSLWPVAGWTGNWFCGIPSITRRSGCTNNIRGVFCRWPLMKAWYCCSVQGLIIRSVFGIRIFRPWFIRSKYIWRRYLRSRSLRLPTN